MYLHNRSAKKEITENRPKKLQSDSQQHQRRWTDATRERRRRWGGDEAAPIVIWFKKMKWRTGDEAAGNEIEP